MPLTPSCPRCGYDLFGVASSWTESCPLEGVCSECGLIVRWAEVLNPALTVPRWSFEHAPQGERRARLRRTFLAALRPVRFWSELRLEHPVRRWRLTLYIVAMILLSHLFAVAASCYLQVTASLRGARLGYLPPWGGISGSNLWPYTLPQPSFDSYGNWRLDGETAPTCVIWLVAVWASLTPLAFLVLIDTFRQARVRVIHLARAAAYSATAVPFIAIGILAGAVSSPSRGLTLRLGLGPVFVSFSEFVFYGGLLATSGWLTVFWWIVPRRYLRLPAPRLVSAAMLVLGLLGAFVFVVLIVVAQMSR